MKIGDWEVLRDPFAFGEAEDLRGGEIDDPRHSLGLGRQEHVPGAEDIRWPDVGR